MAALGNRVWLIPDGYLPSDTGERVPGLESHEAVCLLNTGEDGARVSIVAYFADREPVGPFELAVPARRTRHVRTDGLRTADGAGIPRDTPYALSVTADVPVAVQHSRLDSRAEALTLMTTMAHPAG